MWDATSEASIVEYMLGYQWKHSLRKTNFRRVVRGLARGDSGIFGDRLLRYRNRRLSASQILYLGRQR